MNHSSKESVAYDYSRFDNRRNLKRGSESGIKPLKTTKKATRASMLPFAGLFIMVFIVSCLIISNYVKANELSIKAADLEGQLQKLKSENTILKADQERLMNLTDVEEYAENHLDMIKLDKSQIEYIQLNNPDKVEVAKNDDRQVSQFMLGIINSFNIVVEYLS